VPRLTERGSSRYLRHVNSGRAAYTLRRAVRFPVAFYVFHRQKDPSPAAREYYEQNVYRRSLYALRRALLENPDLLVDFDLDETSVVVDGGAYLGNWAERVVMRSGARLYAFEPNPAVLPRLHDRIDRYPSVSVHEFGLGSSDATIELTLQGPGSSFFPTNYFAKKRNVDTTTARIRDAAQAFDDLELSHIDLLALNIEGSEFEVLPRLIETGWIHRTDALLIQFHEWLPAAHRRRRAIQRKLQETHTKLFYFPWAWEAWRRQG